MFLKFNHKVRHFIDLVIVLIQKELKVRYKSSFFGYLWSIGNPLAFAFVFFIAFKIVMKIPMKDYALFLITALFPWQWFSNSVTAAPMIFLGNSTIIKKVNFPRNTLPLAIVMQDMTHFIMSIPVIIFFMAIYHRIGAINFSWLYGIPLLLAIQTLITYGLTLMVSSLNLFFRDLERLTGILITLLFYCTPIIYPLSMVPEKYHSIINLNPLSPLMVSWRNLFLEGKLQPGLLVISFASSLIVFAVGHLLYRKLSWKFAEVL